VLEARNAEMSKMRFIACWGVKTKSELDELYLRDKRDAVKAQR
jgi:hypothetical protein